MIDSIVHLPLTFNCGGANMLRDLGIREHAYPFDWTIKNRGTILMLLKNKGEGFLLDENTIIGKNSFKHKYENNDDKWVVLKHLFDKHTGTLVVHDYPAEGTEISSIREKYKNRFKRLDTHLSQANKVIIYADKYQTFTDLSDHKDNIERLGFNLLEHLPEDVSINTIKEYIVSHYNINNIDIKYE